MPLPTDEHLIQLGNRLLAQFDKLFGLHPGFRPAHAKGILLTGTFTPSPEAESLTRAPHIARESVPVTLRFSNSTGIPVIPDSDPNANPRGLAIRFYMAEHVHTDIISHSTDGFPTRTGDEFLKFLEAVPDPQALPKFLAAHPATLAYVQTPKPAPSSFAREAYFGVTAFKFTNAEGVSRFGRYRIVPDIGVEHLENLDGKSPDYLFDEIKERVAAGPIRFHIQVQLAKDGDTVDDATVHWPEDRAVMHLGSIVLNKVMDNNEAEQKKIIFDPIPRVDGLEPSADPLLELRAAIYLLSGRRRRQA